MFKKIIPPKAIVQIGSDGVKIISTCAKDGRGEFAFFVEVEAGQYSTKSRKKSGVQIRDIPVGGNYISFAFPTNNDPDFWVQISLKCGKKYKITKSSAKWGEYVIEEVS